MGKAHSSLEGFGACSPGKFENLHCLRLILGQSGRYFRHCSFEVLAYASHNSATTHLSN